MQRLKVQSLQNVEMAGREVRLHLNEGELTLIFPREIWEHVTDTPYSPEPTPEELEDLQRLKEHLFTYARENNFATVLEDYPSNNGVFELVLRPEGFLAVSTAYFFTPVARTGDIEWVSASLPEDPVIEQAYVVSVVADPQALEMGSDEVQVLCMRDRRCTSSRFEMASELWQVLSDKMAWENVKPFPLERGN